MPWLSQLSKAQFSKWSAVQNYSKQQKQKMASSKLLTLIYNKESEPNGKDRSLLIAS